MRELSGAAVVVRGQLRRDRRGPLHQPMGSRLQTGVPAARQVAPDAARSQPSCLHGNGDRPRAARHRRSTRPARTGRVRRLVRPPEPRVPGAAARDAEEAAARGSLPAHEGGRDHLLHVAARGRCARGLADGNERDRAARITPACRTQSGAATRTRSSASAPTSWWQQSPSAWASTARMSGSWSTPARRDRSSITSRSPAAPAVTASRPSVC